MRPALRRLAARAASPGKVELLLLVAAGLALRLGLMMYWHGGGLASVQAKNIYDDYVDRGLQTLRGVPQNLYHAPLYGWILAGAFAVLGERVGPAMLLQAAASSAAPLLLFALALDWGWTRAQAFAAAAILAVDPLAVYFSYQPMAETVSTLLSLGFFWVLVRARRRPGWALGLAAGAMLGINFLCRFVYLAFVPFWFAAEWIREPRWGRLRRLVVPAALALGTVLGAWGLRNRAAFGRFNITGSEAGTIFYEGFSIDEEELWNLPYWRRAEAKTLGFEDELAENRHYWAKGFERVRELGAWSAAIVALKAVKFWRIFPMDPYPWAVRIPIGAYYTFLFASAILGLTLLKGRHREMAVVYLLFLCLTALHTVFTTTLRFRVPIEPMLCLFAGLYWGRRMQSLAGRAPR